MPRPRKCRQVCNFPQTLAFLPEEYGEEQQAVRLTVDEYETIRLIDKEGFSQEQCGEFMKIARATVQQIYASARKKLADMLVEGLPLYIGGGDIQLCNGINSVCSRNSCIKQSILNFVKPKGEFIMRIAVTYENGAIFQHFGNTEQFKLYDIEDGKVTAEKIADTNGQGHGALSGFLTEAGADILICGGIGGGAQMALAEAGIKLYGGVSGMADDAVKAYLAGNLDFNPNVQCNHHGHEHGHSCGEHHCGENKHGCTGHGA